jgi:Gram-negative bacterial TonB protein C-terminal
LSNGEKIVDSSVNFKSGLHAVGALRPEESNSQEPVAFETTVTATGARPGDRAAQRQLFTEETQTVLVFEHGAVIRLSAAVADGQLLFLSNKATGKEVVTQVLRKRSFRPTNCYVDLEFTEACPGFWGIEFPKTGAASNGNSAKLSSDEDSEGKRAIPATPPSLQEVDRLKHEVAELQTQLKALLQTGPSAVQKSGGQPLAKAASGISAELAKKEEAKRLEELFAMEAKQEEAQLPSRSLAFPTKSAKNSLQKNGGRKWMIAAGAAIVLMAAAGAAYRFGGFGATSKTVGEKSVQSQPAPVSSPRVSPGSASHNLTTMNATSGSAKNPVVDLGAARDGAASEPPAESTARTTLNSRGTMSPLEAKNPDASSSRNRQPSTGSRSESMTAMKSAGSGSSIEPSLTVAASAERRPDASAVSLPIQEEYVAPKLVKGSKSVAPPEAIRNYVAGNVNMDAVVDATGRVRSVAILSGPAKLHATAVEVMKQYLYEPARKNGKPVSAHVQVSLQFWYAP